MRDQVWKDNGWKSRKIWIGVFLAVFSELVLFGGLVYVIAQKAAEGLFSTFAGGVVGITSVVVTAVIAGNVTSKLVATKLPATAPVKTKDAAQKVSDEPGLPEP